MLDRAIVPTVQMSASIEGPWIGMDPVRLGRIAAGPGAPACYVTVDSERGPLLRIDLYTSSDEVFAFQEAHVWSQFLVIGWGHGVYLVDLRSREIVHIDLGCYFGHAYPAAECLLVASAERLFRIEPDGSVKWRSEPLGIDGVVVHDVSESLIEGDGEWDPPGGWRPFRILAGSGTSA